MALIHAGREVARLRLKQADTFSCWRAVRTAVYSGNLKAHASGYSDVTVHGPDHRSFEQRLAPASFALRGAETMCAASLSFWFISECCHGFAGLSFKSFLVAWVNEK